LTILIDARRKRQQVYTTRSTGQIKKARQSRPAPEKNRLPAQLSQLSKTGEHVIARLAALIFLPQIARAQD